MPTAKNAVRADATHEHVTVAFDGETYTIPPAGQWPLDALDAFEDGRMIACVRTVLGEDQYRRFRSRSRTIGDLMELWAAMEAAAAGGEGKSLR